MIFLNRRKNKSVLQPSPIDEKNLLGHSQIMTFKHEEKLRALARITQSVEQLNMPISADIISMFLASRALAQQQFVDCVQKQKRIRETARQSAALLLSREVPVQSRNYFERVKALNNTQP